MTLSIESGYYEQVYDVTRSIPFGMVTTYGIIADIIGVGSARMVGWALNRCHTSYPPVPAHRVVNRKGELSGRNHFPNPVMMQKLLENEGISVVDNSIVNFDEHLWRPTIDS